MSNIPHEVLEYIKNHTSQDTQPSEKTKKSNKGIASAIITGVMIVSVILVIAFMITGHKQPEVAEAQADPIAELTTENEALTAHNKELEKQIKVNNLMIESNNKKLEALTYAQN